MLIVGELINASRKSVREIIEKRDAEGIAKLAREQRENGAHYIDVNAGVEFLQAIERIIRAFQGVHTMCGLSNISFGLPERKHINQTFMVMAIARGLDGAIVNPLDGRMMGCITTAETLMGRDPYCTSYLKAFRAGKLAAA
jgi:cobalamin-dependent methionine synthase I